MKIIQMFQNTMLKRPLTRDRLLCAIRKTHTGTVSLVVGPVYVFVMFAEYLFAWRCDRMLHPTYTSKLNTLLRRKFIIEFVPFGTQTYQLEFHLAVLISDLQS